MGNNPSKVEEAPQKSVPQKIDFQRLFPPRHLEPVTAGKNTSQKSEKRKKVASLVMLCFRLPGRAIFSDV